MILEIDQTGIIGILYVNLLTQKHLRFDVITLRIEELKNKLFKNRY
jgi:hypothetical protein